jgi:methyl-accepting chemotaxis protein
MSREADGDTSMAAAAVSGRAGGWRRGLAVRFCLLVGVAFLLVAGTSAYFAAVSQLEALRAEVERQAGRLADLLAANSAAALFSFSYPKLEGLVEGFGHDAAIRFVDIRDKDGKVVMASRGARDRRGVVVATRDAVAGGQVVGSVTVGVSTEAADAALADALRGLILRELGGLAVLCLAIAYLVRREVVGPLSRMNRVVEAAQGRGDLTVRLEVRRADEIGALSERFNGFMDTMEGLLRPMRAVAHEVAAAAGQLAAASKQLSSGAQAQASALEETAASLEEITGTVRQNADNARQAHEVALVSRQTAEKGGRVVVTAVSAMEEISRASRKIAEIVTVIDEIAFQTNLLALNAAVEAARAGDQGRGFAVVAGEVRSLAQRSAGAAQEIRTLIRDSVRKVEGGSELASHSGQSLEEIVATVSRVTDIVTEIAAASREQSQGIDHVNRAVTQMDQVVQQNAAQTEELSSTAHALSAQADQLEALVGRFTLGDALPSPAPPQGPAGRRGREASRKKVDPVAASPARIEKPST